MSDQEKEKPAVTVTVTETVPLGPPSPSPAPPKPAPASEDTGPQYFFGEPLVGFDPSEVTGNLIVIEGMDGSGRSTQITLLQEWLESEGFAVQTSGLRRSNLVGRDIDELLEHLAPFQENYRHHRTGESNGDSHLKSLR